MPLYKRGSVPLHAYPPIIKEGETFFVISYTQEGFSSYEQYLERIAFYRLPHFQCAATGRSGFTFVQALRSEAEQQSKVAALPVEVQHAVLARVQHSDSPLTTLVEDIWAELKAQYDAAPAGARAPVPSKSTLKSLIVLSASRGTYPGASWVVHHDIAARMGLPLALPGPLAMAYEDHRQKTLKRSRDAMAAAARPPSAMSGLGAPSGGFGGGGGIGGGSGGGVSGRNAQGRFPGMPDGVAMYDEVDGPAMKKRKIYPMEDSELPPPLVAMPPTTPLAVGVDADMYVLWCGLSDLSEPLALSRFPFSFLSTALNTCIDDDVPGLLVQIAIALLRLVMDSGGEAVDESNWLKHLATFLESEVEEKRLSQATVDELGGPRFGSWPLAGKVEILLHMFHEALDSEELHAAIDDAEKEVQAGGVDKRKLTTELVKKRAENSRLDRTIVAELALSGRGSDASIDEPEDLDPHDPVFKDLVLPPRPPAITSEVFSSRQASVESNKLLKSWEDKCAAARAKHAEAKLKARNAPVLALANIRREREKLEKDFAARLAAVNTREAQRRVRSGWMGRDRNHNTYLLQEDDQCLVVQSAQGTELRRYTSRAEATALRAALNAKGHRERALAERLADSEAVMMELLAEREAADEAAAKVAAGVAGRRRNTREETYLDYVNDYFVAAKPPRRTSKRAAASGAAAAAPVAVSSGSGSAESGSGSGSESEYERGEGESSDDDDDDDDDGDESSGSDSTETDESRPRRKGERQSGRVAKKRAAAAASSARGRATRRGGRAAPAAAKKKGKGRVVESSSAEASSDGNEDVCADCDKPGSLICCDQCPKAFHLKCVSLTKAPRGSWTCPLCVAAHGSRRRRF